MKILIEIDNRHINEVIGNLSDSDLCPSLLKLDECDNCGNGCWECWTNALNLKPVKRRNRNE